MQLNTYLFFDGNCREAFEHYAKVLGGTVTAMLPFAEAPNASQIDTASHDLIMHGCLEVDGYKLMGTDSTPDHPHEGIKGASVTINIDSPERAREIFDALSEGGQIQMPMDKTFWARAFGAVVDRFGVSWMVNCE